MSAPVFLTPLGALVALAALLPPAAALLRERRLRAVRSTLGLAPPSRLPSLASGVAAGVAVLLLGLAAAQPALAHSRGHRVRTDAQAYVVVDASRSMEAVSHRGAATRFDRARALALQLRDAMPDVPWGVASFTDRTLVHAFPTPDRAVVAATLAQSIGIDRPPPTYQETTATELDTLGETAMAGFFPPTARKRLVVLFTDAESRPFSPRSLAYMLHRGRVRLVVVRLWGAHDRVYDAHGRDLGYRPVPATEELRQLRSVGIPIVDERSFGTVPTLARRILGRGPTIEPRRDRSLTPLAPYAVLAACAPLAFVLVRANR